MRGLRTQALMVSPFPKTGCSRREEQREAHALWDQATGAQEKCSSANTSNAVAGYRERSGKPTTLRGVPITLLSAACSAVI